MKKTPVFTRAPRLPRPIGMPQVAVSPFKKHSQAGPIIEPPLEILKHSSSPTKRSFSRPGAGGQLSPSKVRGRSPLKNQAVPRLPPEPTRRQLKKELSPEVVWQYTQLAYNVIMVCIGAVVLIAVMRIFRNDVRNRVEKQSSGVIFEIEECARNYVRNKCMPGQRVPMLEEQCAQLEKCMNKNPEKILHSQIFAEAVSEALASLLGELSWKSILFLITGGLGVPFVVNCLGPSRQRR